MQEGRDDTVGIQAHLLRGDECHGDGMQYIGFTTLPPLLAVGLFGQCKSIMETLHVFLVTSCLHGSKHTLYILSDGIHNQCIL